MAWVAVAVGGATALIGASSANKAASQQSDAAQAQIDLYTRMYEDSVARGDETLAAQAKIYLDTLNNQTSTSQRTADNQIASSRRTVNKQNALATQTRNQQQDIAQGYQTDALGSSQQTLNEQLGYFAPYADTGYDANAQLAIEYGIAPGESNYMMTPGAQYQMDTGISAVESSAAAAGGLMSGATMDAVNYTAQGIVDQDIDEYLMGLDSMANRGLSASSGMASAQGTADAQRQNIYANTAGMNTNAVTGYGNTMNAAYGTQGMNDYNAYAMQGANDYNAYGAYGANMGGAEQATFNALAGLNSNYGAQMADAYANQGNAAAAGTMGGYNALMGGVTNGLSLWNYQQGTSGAPTYGAVPPTSQTAASSGWGLY